VIDRRRVVASAVLAGATAGSLVLAPTSAPAADKTRHDLTVSSEEVGGDDTNEFRLFGTVSTYKGRKLKIQISINSGDWKLWRTTVTDAEDGAFSHPIYGGRRGSKVCYKVVVPSTKRYKTTKAKAGCIKTA
jgi:hypothetical protein